MHIVLTMHGGRSYTINPIISRF